VKTLYALFIAGFLAITLHAQSSSNNGKSSNGPTKNVQQAPVLPESMRPKKLSRMNTAQRGAAFNSKPLLQQLPGLKLNDASGNASGGSALPRQGHWLLLFRKDTCLSCDRLMNNLAQTKRPELQGGTPYVIVVEGSSATAAETVKANFSTMAGATWLTDPTSQTRVSLNMKGAPMLYAMDGAKIVWRVAGNLGSPAKIEQLAAAWVASGPPVPGSIAKSSN
jgi:hypothetical protein